MDTGEIIIRQILLSDIQDVVGISDITNCKKEVMTEDDDRLRRILKVKLSKDEIKIC